MRLPPMLQGFVRAATLAALCCSLLPAPTLAQSSDAPPPKKKTQKKSTTKPATKPATKPVEAPAEKPAAAPAPAPAPAPREDPPPPPRPRAARAAPVVTPAEAGVGKLEIEGSLGLAIPFKDGFNTGFKLNAAGFYGLMPLGPTMLLQVGGNLGFTYHGVPSPLDGSIIWIDILPTARLRFTINDKLYAMADGGLGLAIGRSSISVPGGFIPDQTSTDVGLLIKLGAGIGYDLNEKLSLVALPAINIYIKDGSMTNLTLMVGASMKL
ncbi:MAG: hypothetical protein HZB56_21550 [Deltaproteobacteria bacterium]|nr:hypothetical protein [Deltaproteobacteria bacterium]